jgi:tripartite-type tricarboxylate transporter receptor subunit TctC
MYKRIIVAVFTVFLLSQTGLIGSANAADPYFKGKTITLLVGYSSGQTDLTARIFARHLKSTIAGNPNVIVKNMAGAGTLKAQNFLAEKAKPDGLTIGFNPFLVMAQLTEAKGMRFKYQDQTFIAGILSAPFMSVARTDTVSGGLKSPADIKMAKSLKYTGRHPMNIIDITATSGLDALGVKYNYVSGYRGDAKIAKSLEQSETNVTGSTLSAWKNNMTRMAKDGSISKLYYHQRKGPDGKFADDPKYAGWPTFQEVYRKVHGKAPSGQLWDAYEFAIEMFSTATWVISGPPKMNKMAAMALQEGFRKVAADSALQADAKKTVGTKLGYVGPSQADKALARLRTIDAKTIKFWKDRTARLIQ